MAHCQTTNLFGEANFGDLDLGLYNRRNCTNHHHSSINTLKRNKTVGWYLGQPPDDKKRFLAQATLMGKEIQSQSQPKEQGVHQETQARLQLHHDQQRKKEAIKV